MSSRRWFEHPNLKGRFGRNLLLWTRGFNETAHRAYEFTATVGCWVIRRGIDRGTVPD